MFKWMIFENYIPGETERVYHVGRQIREGEPLHSGNIEWSGSDLMTRSEAEQEAERLNKETRDDF